jgi:DNA repair photolyase
MVTKNNKKGDQTMPTRVIYEPKGSAKEYADLALNLYKGCYHGCKYCYVPGVCKMTRENFNTCVEPKKNIIERLCKDLRLIVVKKEFESQSVLMSFTCDPYQPLDRELELTRKAMIALNTFGFPIKILTKADKLPQRDFDILSEQKDSQFGITLSMTDSKIQKEWEPNAGTPKQRIDNLKKAKEKGINTWLSLEPIINVDQALKVIDLTYEFTDFYGVGKLNYNKHQKTIDWKKAKEEIINKLEKRDKKYLIHKSLEEAK